MQKFGNLVLTVMAACLLATSGCSWYDHKDYPRQSWFAQGTDVIEADQFKKVENPLKIALEVNYVWEGEPIVVEPFEKRRADWRETYGLWFAAEHDLEKTGLFEVVEPDDEEKQATFIIDVSREMDPKTKAEIKAKEEDPENHPEKIIYIYDMDMKTKIVFPDGKVIDASSSTDRMFIGHDDSKEKNEGKEPERFTFSYFNNMDFHTEFARRFFKQMLYENLKQLEPKIRWDTATKP